MKIIKIFFKRHTSPKFYKRVKDLKNDIVSFFFIRNLNKVAKTYGTDKYGSHSYTKHYKTHFKKVQFKQITLLEIGIGGYDDPLSGGQSLRMWKRYFPFGKIFGIDIFDKSFFEEKRIRIFKGSQVDKDFLYKVNNEAKGFDIIIDDGSHINQHVISSFEILFPLLKEGGIYVVEDIQTAYWPDYNYGGDSRNLNNPNTSINFFKRLIDGLNHEEFIRPGYSPTYYDQNIISMHFYHNMVFIYKGPNNEGSNFIKKNHRVKA